LANHLVQRYEQAQQDIAKRVQELPDAHSGLLGAFLDKLAAVLKAIEEFKARLQGVVQDAGETLDLIIKDSIAFLRHLLDALAAGFHGFVANIVTHLEQGFVAWLTGGLGSLNIHLPAEWDLKGVISLVLQVLGISWEKITGKIRAKVEKLLGPRAMRVVDKIIEYAQAAWSGGVQGLIDKLKEDLGSLKEMLFGAIKSYLIETIVKTAIAKLVALSNPVGEIVEAVMDIYKVVMFFIEKANQILTLVETIVRSVSRIAHGDIGGAAAWVEQAMANTIPIMIGFLADLLGLGDLPNKIKEFIEAVQGAVDHAIEQALEWLIEKGKELFKSLFGKDDKKDDADDEKSLAVKEKAKQEVAAATSQPFNSKEDLQKVVDGIHTKLAPEGLKSLVLHEEAATPGKFDIVAAASAPVVAGVGSVAGSANPGVSAPGLGRIGTHGSKPSSLRTGPEIHWLESEHIIPFAVGKRLWEVANLVVPGRGGHEDRGQTTIMIYKGAADVKTPVDLTIISTFEAAVTGVDLQNRLNRARRAHEAGDEAAMERDGRELISLLLQGLRTAKNDAVARTDAAIATENSSHTDGNPLTNGQRRAAPGSSEPPLPTASDVAQAANTQFDNIIDLARQEVEAANALR